MALSPVEAAGLVLSIAQLVQAKWYEWRHLKAAEAATAASEKADAATAAKDEEMIAFLDYLRRVDHRELLGLLGQVDRRVGVVLANTVEIREAVARLEAAHAAAFGHGLGTPLFTKTDVDRARRRVLEDFDDWKREHARREHEELDAAVSVPRDQLPRPTSPTEDVVARVSGDISERYMRAYYQAERAKTRSLEDLEVIRKRLPEDPDVLSPEALELLKAAAATSDAVLELHDMADTQVPIAFVRVAGRDYGTGDARTSARYRKAFEELLARGFAERLSGIRYRLTPAGLERSAA